MKLIKEAQYKTFRDKDSIIKMGPRDTILWEGRILETIKHIYGVPHLRLVSSPMGHDIENKIITMDAMPGVSLGNVIHKLDGKQREMIVNTLHTIVSELYLAGVAHLRINEENVLVTEDLTVSLVGFGKARILHNHDISRIYSSPDFSGQLQPEIFDIEAPIGQVTSIEGSYSNILSLLSKAPLPPEKPALETFHEGGFALT